MGGAFGFEVSHEFLEGDVVVVRVVGDVDVYTFAALRAYLNKILGAGVVPRHVGLDTSGCEFWDSTAFGVLVGFAKSFREVREGGVLAFVSPPEWMLKMLKITGLEKPFPVVQGTDGLLAWLADFEAGADSLVGAEESCGPRDESVN
ncbi:STAS domain-containing protein [Streptomyces sp. Midd1]|uniref:STAS domain-containing protein n=1 Tax=Streptomyces sp. Midd3 TaxID=3161191 RepID=UPI0034DADD1F